MFTPLDTVLSYHLLTTLQDVDGPDPTLLHPGERRGIVIVIGENDQVEKSLSIFEKAYETNRLGIALGSHTLIGLTLSRQGLSVVHYYSCY